MDQQIKKLLEENLELNKEMHKMLKTVKNFILVQRVAFVLKILIILIPIILGLIYLPPIFKEYMPKVNKTIDAYQGLLGVNGEIPSDIDSSADQELNSEMIENLSPQQKQRLLQMLQN